MELKPNLKQDLGAGRKRAQKLWGAAVLALFLAACSSGIEAPPTEAELAPAASGSVRNQLRSTADDAEEASSGSMVAGSGNRVLDFSSSQKVGLRFTGVDVPQGAKITKAYIRMMPSASDSGSTTLTIRAHATDSASQFRASKRNISSRSLTSASEKWRTPSWRKGKVAQTSDISDVVQEVVSRRGWNSGNALALIVSGENRNERRAVSANGNRKLAPVLYVWYESASSGGSNGGSTSPRVSVSSSQREWHSRLMRTVSNPRYADALDPKKLAASGDLYKIGRELNMHVTSMILAYRETGDRDIVRHLESVMNTAKGQLRDTNRDGFKNWTYKNKTGDHTTKRYVGTDLIALDEMLTHSMVAAAAYTFKQAGFSSSARFWTDYLENDFEAKWRKRSGKSSSYPFVNHFLMHPTTQFVRYHLYMHKLTGKSSYYSEAKRLAGTVRNTMRSNGGGYVWDHRVGSKGGCQPMTYVKYTTQAMVDIASMDSSLFSSSFMRQVANTMANKVLKNSSGTSLASNICGSGSFGSIGMFVAHPFAQLARWDNSGKLRTAAERAYAARERNASSPSSANLPATMVFTLGR